MYRAVDNRDGGRLTSYYDARTEKTSSENEKK